MNLKTKLFLFLPVLAITLGTGCSNKLSADYETVFPQDSVPRIDITVAADDWQAMLNHMSDNRGEFGAGIGKPADDFWDVYWPAIDWSVDEPLFVECRVLFGDKTWEHVGLRFKGETSLRLAWWLGKLKLPFKLDFDEYETTYPETQNQRFFGFKKLGFGNNVWGGAYLRQKVTADLFREADIPAPRTAFYRVFVDVGEGSTYFGLYTVSEYPQDTMFDSVFGATGGNLYKPGLEAIEAWRQDSDPDEETFSKRSNEENADWSDIEELLSALHASSNDSESWRANLEDVFNVTDYVKWLAMTAVLENYDVSGNVYLYGSPAENGRLHWVVWDLDGSFPSFDISNEIEPFFGAPLTLDMASITEDAPQVRYVLDDFIYGPLYRQGVETFSAGGFAAAALKARFQREHDLISPYVVGNGGESEDYTFTNSADFDLSLRELFDYIDDRHVDIADYLAESE